MILNWKAVACFLTAMILTTLLVINGQKPAKNEDEPDLNQFPTVEYVNQKALTEKQKTRSKKYNSKQSPVITEDTRIFSSNWDFRLPALPVKISAAVIIGEVTDAQAYLSDDQTKIYSEFVVQIHQVQKNDNRVPLAAGNSVTLERSGGRVRFPSGKMAVSATNHQDLPRTGRRYLFFLTHEGPDARDYEDFHILAGYELRDGLVFPLDKSSPGDAYKGTTQTLLLNDLAVALAGASPLTQ